jgi:hypothetical protein
MATSNLDMLVFSIFWWYLEETELKRRVFSTTNISFVVEVSEFPLCNFNSTRNYQCDHHPGFRISLVACKFGSHFNTFQKMLIVVLYFLVDQKYEMAPFVSTVWPFLLQVNICLWRSNLRDWRFVLQNPQIARVAHMLGLVRLPTQLE